MPESAPKTTTLNLALQGGGSHGALTWGVLDALLEDGRLAFDGVSGTSAGAMNAVTLAHGFAQGVQEFPKDAQAAHAAGREYARRALSQLWEGVGTMGSLMWGVPLHNNPMMAMMSQWLSPYQTNPLDFNPLRRLLEGVVDFDLLCHTRKTQVPNVFVCATNVRTGRGEIFSGERLSADAVMASACLPMMFKAVQIDGELYWDGGYSGNPALYPLIYQTGSADILLVQINPIAHNEVPGNAQDIMERMNEVTFNASLLAEIRAIEFVRRLLLEGKLDARRYKNVLLHRVDGGALLAPFGSSSKLRADLPFVRQLFELGRTEGARWLEAHYGDLGVRPTINITDNA